MRRPPSANHRLAANANGSIMPRRCHTGRGWNSRHMIRLRTKIWVAAVSRWLRRDLADYVRQMTRQFLPPYIPSPSFPNWFSGPGRVMSAPRITARFHPSVSCFSEYAWFKQTSKNQGNGPKGGCFIAAAFFFCAERQRHNR